MTELMKYSLIFVGGVLVSSFSQVLLKKAAGKKYDSRLKEYLNVPVMTAYTVFLICTLISVYALRVIPLSLSPILESTGYIFIGILGYVFFREKLTGRQLAGFALILLGIVIYSL